MPKIETYKRDNDLMSSDTLLGTDAIDGGTVNFTLQSLRDYMILNKGLFTAPDGVVPIIQDGILYPSFISNSLDITRFGATEYFSNANSVYVSSPFIIQGGTSIDFTGVNVGDALWIYDMGQTSFVFKVVDTVDLTNRLITVTEAFNDAEQMFYSVARGGCIVDRLLNLGTNIPLPSTAILGTDNEIDVVTPQGVAIISLDPVAKAKLDIIKPYLQVDEFQLSGVRTNVSTVGNNEFSTITMQDNFMPNVDTFIQFTLNAAQDRFVSNAGSYTQYPDGTVARVTDTNESIYNGYVAYTTLGIQIGIYPVSTNGSGSYDLTLEFGEAPSVVGSYAIGNPGQGNSTTFDISGDQTGVFSAGDILNASDGTYTFAINSLIFNSITDVSTLTVTQLTISGSTFSRSYSLSRFSTLAPYERVISTFSYTPDTGGTVYSTSVVDEPFANGNTGTITEHITQVANAITALETNIEWNGTITPATLQGSTTTTGNIFYSITASSIVENQGRWCFASSASVDNALPIAAGTTWDTLNNMFLIEPDRTIFTSLSSLVEVGDSLVIIVNDTSAAFNILAKSDDGNGVNFLQLGTATNVVGVLPELASVSLPESSITLQGAVLEDASSITLDLGTQQNIDSSFAITNGINNVETLLNQNGLINSDIVSTITITDGNSNQVASFTAGVDTLDATNIDIVGQQIASAVNNNTETPINFTSTYDTTTKIVTIRADEGGDHDDWVITINNNDANPQVIGNLVISDAVSNDELVNQIDGGITVDEIYAIGGNQILDVTTLANNTFLRIGDDALATTLVGSAGVTAQSAIGAGLFSAGTARFLANPNNLDIDFSIRKLNTGESYVFDAGADTTTIDSAEFHVNNNGTSIIKYDDSEGVEALVLDSANTALRGTSSIGFQVGATNDNCLVFLGTSTLVNPSNLDRDFIINKMGVTAATALHYNAGDDTLSTNSTELHITANDQEIITYDDSLGLDVLTIHGHVTAIRGDLGLTLYQGTDFNNSALTVSGGYTAINPSQLDRDFDILKLGVGNGNAYRYDAGADTTTIDSDEFHVNQSGRGIITFDDSLGTEALILNSDLTVLRGDTAVAARIGDEPYSSIFADSFTFNNSSNDVDFRIQKMSSGLPSRWLSYDAGDDRLIIDSTNIQIIANDQEILTYDDSFSLGIDIFQVGLGVANTVLRGTSSVEVFIGAADATVAEVEQVFGALAGGIIMNSTTPEAKSFVVFGANGDGIRYTGSSDTLKSDATVFEGIAGQETGTWTPTFNNTGTYTLASAEYARAGTLVNVAMLALIGVGTTTDDLRLDVSSLPFAPNAQLTYGSYLSGAAGSAPGTFLIGQSSTSFIKADGTRLTDDEVNTATSLSITYHTAD